MRAIVGNRHWMIAVAVCAVALLASNCARTSSPPNIAAHSTPRKTVERADHLLPLNQISAPRIRVLLADEVTAFTFESPKGATARQSGHASGKLSPGKIRITASQTSISVGPNRLAVETVIVTPRKNEPFTISYQRDGKLRIGTYPGQLRLVHTKHGLQLINVVDLDSYLAAVLQGELYGNWQFETFRAQAIAARTYALFQMGTTGKRRAFDVWSTERSQVYPSLTKQSKSSKAARAVEQTRGVVMCWASPVGRRVFPTYYSSACGGTTQDVATCLDYPTIPPLAGGAVCSYCKIGGSAYAWNTLNFAKADIGRRLAARFPKLKNLGTILKIASAGQPSHGRHTQVRITGSRDHAMISAYELRSVLGPHDVKSTHFKIVDRGSTIDLVGGRGFGHGVGMCQWGAEGQARQGRNATEILTFYYPQANLARVY